jgi:hypothetical protein
MYPELWLHELARERQREIREFAVRSARRGVGDEYLASGLPPSKAGEAYLYVVHSAQRLCNWARRQRFRSGRSCQRARSR